MPTPNVPIYTKQTTTTMAQRTTTTAHCDRDALQPRPWRTATAADCDHDTLQSRQRRTATATAAHCDRDSDSGALRPRQRQRRTATATAVILSDAFTIHLLSRCICQTLKNLPIRCMHDLMCIRDAFWLSSLKNARGRHRLLVQCKLSEHHLPYISY